MSLLRAVAAFGGPVTATELVAVTGRPVLDVVDACTAAVRGGSLTESAAGFDFPDDAARAAVLADVGPSSLRALRAAAARALADGGAAVERVATLLVQSDEHPGGWTLAWLSEHAEELVHRQPALAVVLLRRAQSPQRPALQRLLGRALLWSGQIDDARRHAQALLHRPGHHGERLELHALLAEAALVAFDAPRAQEHLAAAQAAARTPQELASGRAAEAVCRLLTGDVDAAVELIESTDGATDPVGEVYRLQAAGALSYLEQRFDEGVELLEQADACLAAGRGYPTQFVYGRLLLAECLSAAEPDRARAVVESARQVAYQVGGGLRPWLHMLVAEIDSRAGRWDTALTEVQTALELDNRYGLNRVLHALVAESALLHGDLDGGRHHLQLAEQALASSSPLAAFYESHAVVAATLLAEREGRIDDAVQLVRQVARDGLGPHPQTSIAWLAPALVRIALAGGDRALAERLAAGAAGQPTVELYCRGVLDADPDVLVDAARELADVGRHLIAANAAEHAAQLLAADRPEQARAAAELAMDGYTRLSADGELGRARAALRAAGLRLGVTGPRRRPDTGPDSLTPTERRVAELVADGLSNAEIAHTLVVSPRTVQFHVSRILRKLGVRSRAGVATQLTRA